MPKIIKVKVKRNPYKPTFLTDLIYNNIQNPSYRTFDKFMEDLLVSYIFLGILDRENILDIKDTCIIGKISVQRPLDIISTVHFTIDLSDIYDDYLFLIKNKNYPEDIAFNICSLNVYNMLIQYYDKAYDITIKRKGGLLNVR